MLGLSLIANANPLDLLASVTLDVAAPVEPTVAALISHFLNEIVASAAAQRGARVAAGACCAVAFAPVSAFDV
jgi:hypothetical protein